MTFYLFSCLLTIWIWVKLNLDFHHCKTVLICKQKYPYRFWITFISALFNGSLRKFMYFLVFLHKTLYKLAGLKRSNSQAVSKTFFTWWWRNDLYYVIKQNGNPLNIIALLHSQLVELVNFTYFCERGQIWYTTNILQQMNI